MRTLVTEWYLKEESLSSMCREALLPVCQYIVQVE